MDMWFYVILSNNIQLKPLYNNNVDDVCGTSSSYCY